MVVAIVRLYATLRRYAPQAGLGASVELDLPSGATITDLTHHLRMSPDEIKLTFVNSVRQEASYIIQEGDEIVFFPPIAGGSE